MSDGPAPPVGEETAIWRFMDLARFISLLSTNRLWFAKAAQFHDDPWEGFCRVSLPPMPADEYGPECITFPQTQGKPVQISLERFSAELRHRSALYLENAREHLYVNSWSAGDESMAMWQIYGASGAGIAIRSSVGRYKRALRPDVDLRQFAFDKVAYLPDPEMEPSLHIDLSQGAIPVPGYSLWEVILKLAFHKRACFGYEEEWRGALYQESRPDCIGCNITVDVADLIETIFVGPRASSFFLDVVESVMEKFALQKNLARSELLEAPQRPRARDTD